MCGIAGLMGFPLGARKHSIEIMTKALEHRGPDSVGSYSDDFITLGHTRLSIIDLSEKSNQPFHSQDGRYILVYNGEIYNYRELKKELDEYNFQTNSDTEVVLASYMKWGKNCLAKFNGMFAFGIWDIEEHTLFLARDRMGIKPLYYAPDNGLIFASEMRSILVSGFVGNKISLPSIQEYLTYQSVHSPNTVIENIKQVKPGYYITYHKGTLKEHNYWNPTDSLRPNINENIHDQVKNLLYASVERRMVSDVSIGAFLSGGIDSSAIVGIMSHISPKPINTFSMTFDEKGYDESYYSTSISKRFHTNHNQIKLKSQDLLDELPVGMEVLDSPAGDYLNSYFISRFAKKNGLTVALSGLGGDELFGGYPVFKQLPKLSKSFFWSLNPILRKLAIPLIGSVTAVHKKERLIRMLSQKKGTLENLYPIFRSIHSQSQLDNILSISSTDYSPIENTLKRLPNLTQAPLMSQVSIPEIMTYTQNVLLRDIDRMSMAHSLEVRVPFLDHELVEYVLNVSDKFKKPIGSKSLLTQSLDGILPTEIINRKKQGFTFPWEQWMRTELNGFCYEQLMALENFSIFNMNGVVDRWNKFNSGDKSVHWSQIWLLVVLSKWLNKNAKG